MYAVIYTSELGFIIYVFGITVMFSGLGRLYSRLKVGCAGKYIDFILILEIVLELLIIGLKYLE